MTSIIIIYESDGDRGKLRQIGKRAFAQLPYLPHAFRFLSARDPIWWDANIDKFPQRNETRDNLLFSQRIPRVPAVIRSALVDEHCLHEPSKARAKADEANGDCLIRIYPGWKRGRNTTTIVVCIAKLQDGSPAFGRS